MKRLVFLVFLSALIALFISSNSLAADQYTWHVRSTDENYLNNITYGNGIFVAVGGNIMAPSNGIIISSSDCIAWTKRYSDTYSLFRGITYSNGMFVAVGGGTGAQILTSANGIDWTKRTTNVSNQLNAIAYGNGAFVAVGNGKTILRSTNGVTWTEITTSIDIPYNGLYGIAYGNGTFVAVGGGLILTSADGTTWKDRSLSAYQNSFFSGIAFGNGKFVVTVFGTSIASTDGITWENGAYSTINLLSGITYGNGTFAAAGQNGMIIISVNGNTWKAKPSGVASQLNGITYGNGTFIVVGNDIILQSGQANGAANTDNCTVTVETRDNNIYLKIPVISVIVYNSADNPTYYNAELMYTPTTDNQIVFNIANAGLITDTSPYKDCQPSTLYYTDISNYTLHLANMELNGAYLWADLFMWTMYNDVKFIVTDYGSN